MLEGQRATEAPEDGVHGIGPVAVDDGLGVARQEVKLRRRGQRDQLGGDAPRLIEQVVGRRDVDGSAGDRRGEEHVRHGDRIGIGFAFQLRRQRGVPEHPPRTRTCGPIGGQCAVKPGGFIQPVHRDRAVPLGQRLSCTAPGTAGAQRRSEIEQMPGVLPRGVRQRGVRLRRVFAQRRPDGERRVQRGVEGDGVVGVPLQRSEAVLVMVPDLGVGQGVRDGLGEQRVRADLNEGAVGGAGGGDRVAEPDRVAQVGCPVFGVELRCFTGVFNGGEERDDREAGLQVGQRGGQLRQDRVHHGVVGGHVDVHPAGEGVLCRRPGDHGLNGLDRPGHHRLAR